MTGHSRRFLAALGMTFLKRSEEERCHFERSEKTQEQLNNINIMEKQYVIGVDMGGTNSAFGIVNARGEILHRGEIKTNIYKTAEEYVKALGDGINTMIKNSGLEGHIKGIGMGVPDGNMYKGTIEHAANIPWANKSIIPLAKMVSESTGLFCCLTNDANAAAIGEMAYGSARGMKDFIVITLGTGVGSGIVCNGELVCGHDGFAGELGHVIIRRYNGRPCGCGRNGCLETYTSATGVARTAREFLETRSDDSLLRVIDDRPITSKDVSEAAEKGDKIAKEIFEYTGKILGEAFADFITFSSPEAIILFGGLTKAGDLLMKPIEKSMKENLLTMYKDKTKLIFSELPDADAAILGASALVWEK